MKKEELYDDLEGTAFLLRMEIKELLARLRAANECPPELLSRNIPLLGEGTAVALRSIRHLHEVQIRLMVVGDHGPA